MERVSKSHTPMAPKKSFLAPKVKRKYNKKKNTKEALESKVCFKCKSVYETVPETLKGLWRNCEKNLSCNNWYCSACLPANLSNLLFNQFKIVKLINSWFLIEFYL